MPIFSLILYARTQNVSVVKVPQETIFLAKIKCTGCYSPFPKEVGISLTQSEETEKQHYAANFAAKCKNCQRKSFISILNTSKYEVRPNQDGMIKDALAHFQCRGVEIVEVILSDYFTVQVKESGTVFQKADFSDLWCQYDQNISAVVQVQDSKFDIVRTKEK